uniref:Uncharacterized protein n=1 Tax=Parascaris univalens TaxID=6257 RepID=A0A915B9P0_PARUN
MLSKRSVKYPPLISFCLSLMSAIVRLTVLPGASVTMVDKHSNMARERIPSLKICRDDQPFMHAHIIQLLVGGPLIVMNGKKLKLNVCWNVEQTTRPMAQALITCANGFA